MGTDQAKRVDSDYTAKKSLRSLKGLEAVRQVPHMYIVDNEEAGLHQLVWELVDNAIDESLAGFCTKIVVILHSDGSLSVTDNGRGIPIDEAEGGKTGLELVLTELHAGGKFDDATYRYSGGLHGVGVSVVNALSERLVARVARDGRLYEMRFAQGEVMQAQTIVGDSEESGTSIRFWPDGQVLTVTEFSYELLSKRLRQTAYLNPSVTIVLKREGERGKTFRYRRGIEEYVEQLTGDMTKEGVLGELISISDEVQAVGEAPIKVDLALSWSDVHSETVRCFANGIYTYEGGTQLEGFRAALTKACNDYARKQGLLKEKEENYTGDDVRDGLVAIISVKLADPKFQSQAKTKLVNPEMRAIVQRVAYEGLMDYLDAHPKQAKWIVAHAASAAKVRRAAEAARQRARHDKHVLPSGNMLGKLSDCSERDARLRELFIVEGDSAGGSARMARDRSIQAVLPLRGKILNVERVQRSRALASDTIAVLINAIGAGCGRDFDIEKARYHKIIIMTDADVDGAHIRILLLTFFYRYMRPLIEAGYVYVAQPPLYQIRGKGSKKGKYLYSDEELRFEADKFSSQASYVVQRYKGLGEMDPEQLWQTTMAPQDRIMLRVTIGDAATAEAMVRNLMGNNSERRRSFIEEHAGEVMHLDV